MKHETSDYPLTGSREPVPTDQRFYPVPPSPELKDKINQAIAKLQKGSSLLAPNITIQRNKPVGQDDGLIYPGTLFPLGTTASVARNAAADRAPMAGVLRVIAVLVNFTDQAIAQPASHFKDLFFSLGVVPTGSVREYYREVSNNVVDIQGEVVGPVTLSHPMAYYANGQSALGGTAPNGQTMAAEAAQLADALVNFGLYDNDGDGYVDAYIVIHAGSGAEQTGGLNDIWSHKSVLPSPFAADGKTVYGYLTVPENCKLGVCAHELGHLLFGFPDLYDTDYSSEGIGNWCLMSGGSWNGGGDRPAHPSAWCKMKQNWVTVVNQTTNANVTIPDVKASFKIYRLWKQGGAGTEYFLVENRQQTGFDDHLPAGGLLIWHIDDAVGGNTNEAHYEVALLQADGKRDLELNHNRGDGGDVYPGTANNRSFTGSSTPNSKSYAGSSTCVAVTNISDAGPTMTATFGVSCQVIKPIKDIKDKDLKEKDIFDNKPSRDKNRIKEVEKPLHDKPLKEKFEKEIFEKPGDGKFNEQGGFGQHPGSGDMISRLSTLENRMGAIEPFIAQSLRPDLSAGAFTQEDDQAGANPELSFATKRSLDTKSPDSM